MSNYSKASANHEAAAAKLFDELNTDKVCKCHLRTSLVGDGCEVCNPDFARQMQEEYDADDYASDLAARDYEQRIFRDPKE